MARIKIGDKIIGDGQPCFIIAEAGVNHNGELALGYELIDAAKRVGADAVKFQTWKTPELLPRGHRQYGLLKSLELPYEHFHKLKKYAYSQGMIFMSTPDDYESADFLDELGVPAFKIGSGEVNNIPFLEHIARKGKPVILSTGMSTLAEVKRAVAAILKHNKQLVVLHCTSSYPAPYKDVNLLAMNTLRQVHPLVGYSDHTEGEVVPIAARALGAVVIEKHLTLSKALAGPDHDSSANPLEFELMVGCIRVIDQALGSPKKQPTERELKMRVKARKFIVAREALPKGTFISSKQVAFKRAGHGVPADQATRVLGHRLKVSVLKDQPIKAVMVQ